MRVYKAIEADLDSLIDIINQSGFPLFELENNHEGIKEVLRSAENLVIESEEGERAGWVGLSPQENSWWSFDIAIIPTYQGAWQYQETLKEIGKYIFTNLNANGIIGVCYNPVSIKLGLKCGMSITDDKDPCGGVVLRMSREEAQGKWI